MKQYFDPIGFFVYDIHGFILGVSMLFVERNGLFGELFVGAWLLAKLARPFRRFTKLCVKGDYLFLKLVSFLWRVYGS